MKSIIVLATNAPAWQLQAQEVIIRGGLNKMSHDTGHMAQSHCKFCNDEADECVCLREKKRESVIPANYKQFRLFSLITGECEDTWAESVSAVYRSAMLRPGKWLIRVMHDKDWVTVLGFEVPGK
jgi:hypothetical protein